VLAAAPVVQNRIPDGADWNGDDDSGGPAAPAGIEPAAQKPAAQSKPPATALNAVGAVPDRVAPAHLADATPTAAN
jgi:hypothetical protein